MTSDAFVQKIGHLTMIIFVKTSDKPDDDPLEVEIDETSTIDEVIAIVSSITGHPPELISITLDDRELDRETVVSSLPLGEILWFKANLSTNRDTVIDHMFDAGEQQRILEQIRQQRIEENLQYAYQNNPEGFVPYSLLFIECKINNKPVKAMIDTGAQVSILPFSIAKDCEVDYLIDRRWQTVTVGVGVQRSVGRIHALQVQVQGRVWANPFVVLDKGPLDHCILGVDWLTKNQAVIRLAERTLTVGDVVAPFLQPHE